MMLDAALAYAEQGWQVFPLHTPDAQGRCSCRKDCGRDNGKHPRTINGKDAATTDESAIKNWWDTWEDANIGVVTGTISGIVVVDIDPRHNGGETFKTLLEKYGHLDEKMWANTGGGGWHLYFKHPGFNVKSRANALGPGVDIKGDGGYVAAPPSLHASGKRYDWGDENIIPPTMPAWLIGLLQESAPAQPFSTDTSDIPDGARNETLTSLAGSMRRRGMSAEAMYAALSIENESRCKPPLPDVDVRKIAASVANYKPDDPPYIYPTKTLQDGERPDGIYFVNEKSSDLRRLYEQGMTGGLSTGIAALDWYYTVKKKQWTVVTGIASHGKTAVLDTVLHNLADFHGWRIAITSVENQPIERHEAQLISIHTGQPFAKGDIPRMSIQMLEPAEKWLSEHFVFVLPDEGGCSVNGILERVLWVHQNGFPLDGVVIDPWNELEHRRPAGMNETEYVSLCLTRMRHFARTYDMHLWLVAHPTKLNKDIKTGKYPVPTLYDISGSAHFRNKADMGFSVWRDELDMNSPSEVYIQKVRFRECGRVGKVDLYFDPISGRFNETRREFNFTDEAKEQSVWKET